MLDPILILITAVIMVLCLGLILVPAVPVTVLEWALVMVYMVIARFLTGDSAVTLPVGVWVTFLAIVGSTSQIWMPLFGLRGADRLSCTGMIAFFVGMLIGSALIPIPFVGTIAGGVLAVMLVEYGSLREASAAVNRGMTAAKLIMTGMLLEFVFAVTVIASFIVAALAYLT